MKLLTIGIPTYNRASYLEKLLFNILSVCDEMDIEVLVSDNCSTDETPKVLEKFGAFRCLRSLRNAENIGFDRNILHLLANASGRFFWLLGDDDNIDVGQIENVLRLLESHPGTALFFVNYCFDHLPHEKQRAATKLACQELEAQQYADRFLHRATLISTNIINLDYYKKIAVNPACIPKGWIHLHLLLLLADRLKKNGAKIMVIKNEIVIQGRELGAHSLAKWIKAFIDEFYFTLSNTPIKCLDTRRFLKGFYDINIRLRFLNFKDIMSLADPLGFYRKVVKIFNPNLTGKISFWLQYVLGRKILSPFWNGQNKNQ